MWRTPWTKSADAVGRGEFDCTFFQREGRGETARSSRLTDLACANMAARTAYHDDTVNMSIRIAIDLIAVSHARGVNSPVQGVDQGLLLDRSLLPFLLLLHGRGHCTSGCGPPR